ncbi:Short-chain dehydrogenase/reductase SDR [Penicillium camemberti]|uniref:Short-chain dehydrogenase/reductase SDR n=1 Tax=Penicillium camemberti (strain FM 013) TaxID=1429867 RepID=A0A0G4P1X2_PENC3|nr:Short-chain dehydrogenase/reductase SDR [Penicillium camemberti]
MASTGAKVYITARQKDKGQAIANKITQEFGREVGLIELSLDSFDSIRKAATEFLGQSQQLNILINNAGVMASPEGRTSDGYETQFGTNHLGHFLLFQLLKDVLLSSSEPQFNSRVVSVASSAHRLNSVHLGNYNFDRDPNDTYEPWKAYGQSKTANIWFANELDRRYGGKGLHGLSLHPGGMMTELQRYVPGAGDNLSPRQQRQMKDSEQGAATSVWAAIAKELEGRGGVFLDDVQESEPWDKDPTREMLGPDGGYLPHIYDEGSEKKLWQDSLEMVGLPDDL